MNFVIKNTKIRHTNWIMLEIIIKRIIRTHAKQNYMRKIRIRSITLSSNACIIDSVTFDKNCGKNRAKII